MAASTSVSPKRTRIEPRPEQRLYDPDAIRRVKDGVGGGVYVSGSGTLVRALISDGLIDELDLFVYPLTRGTDPRSFAQNAPPTKWSLAHRESYANGVLYLAYRFEPSTASAP
jgi:dihydrofolate reductase